MRSLISLKRVQSATPTHPLNRIVALVARLDRSQHSLEQLIAVPLMPTPHNYNVMLGVHPNRVRARADCGKTGRRTGRPLLLLCVEPPKKSVVRTNRRRSGRHLHPVLGNDLFLSPVTLSQKQVSNPSFVASADPQTATPSRAPAYRFHLLAVDHNL